LGVTCGQALRLIRIVDLLRRLGVELTRIEAEAAAQPPPPHTVKTAEAIAAQLARAARDILEIRNDLSISGREVS
jgi:hypothetical protein